MSLLHAAGIVCTADRVVSTLGPGGTLLKTTFTGRVVITYKGMKLTCAEAVLDHVRKTITVKGEAVIRKGGATLTGYGASYDYASDSGVFTRASITFPPYYGAGREIIKEGGKYVLKDGYLTTCDRRDNPHYRISSAQFVLSPSQVSAQNVKIYLGKMPVFWVPRFSQSLHTKKPFLQVSPGYQTQFGSTLRFTFNHPVSKDSVLKDTNLNVFETAGIGTTAALAGVGLEDTKNKNRYLKTYLAGDSGERGLLYGLLSQYQNEFSGRQNVILDWRWFSREHMFHDFLYNDYLAKSKNPNYLSYTKVFGNDKIFDAELAGDADEAFLSPGRLPELNFSWPYFKAGAMTGNFNSSFTHFVNNDGPGVYRLYNDFSLEKPYDTEYLKLTPFFEYENASYWSGPQNVSNFAPSAGVKAALAFRRSAGKYTQFFSPSFSLFSRFPSEKNVPFNFDLKDLNLSGTFFSADFAWDCWRGTDHLGKIISQNFFNVNSRSFQNSVLTYDFALTKKWSVAGQQIYDPSDTGVIENVNNVFYQTPRYIWNAGNDYYRGSVNGLTAGVTAKLGSGWELGTSVDYDLQAKNLNRWSVFLHKPVTDCLTLEIVAVKSNVTSVYFTIVPTVFARTSFPRQ